MDNESINVLLYAFPKVHVYRSLAWSNGHLHRCHQTLHVKPVQSALSKTYFLSTVTCYSILAVLTPDDIKNINMIVKIYGHFVVAEIRPLPKPSPPPPDLDSIDSVTSNKAKKVLYLILKKEMNHQKYY